ncbi:MAG: Response regulator receiver protein [Parcubacteria group bacterium Gr01-1014_20]|nr:MAG: Response regulator receiver protein [Parcubacteria group bacterium Gr01-1014_20]
MVSKPKNNKTALVIEDERILVRVIETKLEKVGFDVVTARTVDQGLSYIEDVGGIDVIWLDHYLPGEKTGLDFVAKLKSPGSKWAKIPIFLVSNTASDSNVRSYLRLGVSKYCVKAEHRLEEIASDIKSFLDDPRK